MNTRAFAAYAGLLALIAARLGRTRLGCIGGDMGHGHSVGGAQLIGGCGKPIVAA